MIKEGWAVSNVFLPEKGAAGVFFRSTTPERVKKAPHREELISNSLIPASGNRSFISVHRLPDVDRRLFLTVDDEDEVLFGPDMVAVLGGAVPFAVDVGNFGEMGHLFTGPKGFHDIFFHGIVGDDFHPDHTCFSLWGVSLLKRE
jgi:hypothetical protein